MDNLSKEEAAYIAEKTITDYKEKNLINSSFEKQFQRDVEMIYTNLFLSLSSYNDLNTKTYNKIEEQIQKAGEKYVGKGKMPRVELCIPTELTCQKDKTCTKETASSSTSCCEKNKESWKIR